MATTKRKTTNPLDLYANTTPPTQPTRNANIQQPPNMLRQNLLERYKGIQDQMSNLLASKYGYNANLDSNAGFNQPGLSPVGNWGELQEQQGLAQYQKYLDDLYNTRLALEQYDALNQQSMQGMAQAGVVREQAERFLPQQLRMQGMGNVGSSESSLVGIGNTYQRNISDINRQRTQAEQDLLSNYNQALLESERNLSAEQRARLEEYQANIYVNSVYNLQNQTSVEDINRILEEVKGKVNNEQYLDLLEKARIIARALGYTLDGKRINNNLKRIDDAFKESEVFYSHE